MALPNGYDVANWQINTPDLTGREFLFAKATEGTWHDPMYATHIANARRAGLLVGAYHFNRADVSMVDQVDEFIKVAGNVHFYALDVEEENATGVQRFSLSQARTFISRFKAITGKPIGLYMSESGYYEAGQDWDWVAHYGVAAPTRHWNFHQFTSNDGRLDEDRYNGTLAQLYTFAGAPALPDSSTGAAVAKTIITILPYGGGTFTIPANVAVQGFKLDDNDNVVMGPKYAAAPADSTAQYDATMTTTATRGNPFIRATTGALAGWFVGSAPLRLSPNQAPVVDCAPAVKAAVDPLNAMIESLKQQVADEIDAANTADARLADYEAYLAAAKKIGL